MPTVPQAPCANPSDSIAEPTAPRIQTSDNPLRPRLDLTLFDLLPLEPRTLLSASPGRAAFVPNPLQTPIVHQPAKVPVAGPTLQSSPKRSTRPTDEVRANRLTSRFQKTQPITSRAAAQRRVLAAAVAAAPLSLSYAPPPTYPNGFTSLDHLVFNSAWGDVPVLNGTSIRLTSDDYSQAGTVWYDRPMPVDAFQTHFSFTVDGNNNWADGFTFTIQAGDTGQLGGGGGSMGYEGIYDSLAVAFNLYNDGYFGSTVTLVTNGVNPGGGDRVNLEPNIDLHSGHTYDATLNYAGSTLTLTLVDASDPSLGFSTAWAIDIPATVGASSAYVGFTAATGGYTATQDLLNWTYAPVSVANPAAVDSISGRTAHLSVRGQSAAGESALVYNWSVATKPAGAPDPFVAGNGTNAARDATATFFQAGIYTMLATITDPLGGTATSWVTVTVSQALTALQVAPSTPSIAMGQNLQLTAAALDQFGQPMADAPTVEWSVTGGGSIDPQGLFTAAPETGQSVITASVGSIRGTAPVRVVGAPSISASLTPDGRSAQLSLAGLTGNLTCTWSVISAPAGAPAASFLSNGSPDTIVDFTAAGGYTIQAVVSDGSWSQVLTTSVSVAQLFSSVRVAPAAAALQENQTQHLTAQALDQFGQPMAAQPAFGWSVTSGLGSVDASGTYTAPAHVTAATVQATAQGITGSGLLIVMDGVPDLVEPAAATPTTTAGTVELTALGSDDGGNDQLLYTWRMISGPDGAPLPLLSLNGTPAAHSALATFAVPGVYTFTVTISDREGASVSSSVNVTVDGVTTITPDYPGGFASSALTLNGSAKIYRDRLRLTAGRYSESASAYAPAPVDIRSFQTAFSFQLSSADADGLTFIIQGEGPGALGEAGGGLGFRGISRSAAIKFDLYSNDSEGYDSTGLYLEGADPSSSAIDLSEAGIDLHSGHVFSVLATYDGSSLVVTITDAQTQASATQVYGVDLPAIVGGDLAFMGFTAGTGGLTATQDVINWTYQAGSAALPPALSGPAEAILSGASTAHLSVPTDGAADRVYFWTAVQAPSGAAAPTFSSNGDPSAFDPTATFYKAGLYTLMCTISDGGLLTTTAVDIDVPQICTSPIVIARPSVIAQGTSQFLVATAMDQFGDPDHSFHWSVAPGGVGGTIDNDGRYTAPASGTGFDTVIASGNGFSATATVTVGSQGIFSRGEDIGSPLQQGSYYYSADTYTVNGGGYDIWYGSDEFYFASRPAIGDAEIIARVTGLSNTDSWAKGGVMYRASSDPRSAFVDLVATPAAGVSLQWRGSTGDGCWEMHTDALPEPSPENPVWVKLVRSGDWFTGYYSRDGNSWLRVGQISVHFATGAAMAGLAVTAHNYRALATATFTDVVLDTPAAPSALKVVSVSATTATLSWNGIGGADSYAIERSTDGVRWTTIAHVSDGTRYTDTGLTAATSYSYRVAAEINGALSPYSNRAQVTTTKTQTVQYFNSAGAIIPASQAASGSSGVLDGSSHAAGVPGSGAPSTGSAVASSSSSASRALASAEAAEASHPAPAEENPGSVALGGSTRTEGPVGPVPTPAGGSSASGPARAAAGTASFDPRTAASSTPFSAFDEPLTMPPAVVLAPADAVPLSPLPEQLEGPFVLVENALTEVASNPVYHEEVKLAIQEVQQQAVRKQKAEAVVAGVAVTATATLSAGYLIWCVCGGTLLGSMLSTLPFWRWVDPLPILESWEREQQERKQRRKKRLNADDDEDGNFEEDDEQDVKELLE